MLTNGMLRHAHSRQLLQPFMSRKVWVQLRLTWQLCLGRTQRLRQRRGLTQLSFYKVHNKCYNKHTYHRRWSEKEFYRWYRINKSCRSYLDIFNEGRSCKLQGGPPCQKTIERLEVNKLVYRKAYPQPTTKKLLGAALSCP